MLLAIIVVAAFIILARYLPVQKIVLAEGVFDCEKTEFNLLTSKEDRIWYFKYPCRFCWTKGRGGDDWVFREQCPVVIPRHAINLSVEPRMGNSIAVVGGANIFGRLIYFRLTATNYKEEFTQRELIGPGKDFYLRERCIKIMKERYHRLTHEASGRGNNCPELDEIIKAEKEGFANRLEPFDCLPEFRKIHVNNCDWCKKLLMRDEESLREIKILKQRRL